ncbi:GNAT family N-acetyltransferase [Streptomyces sp. NPDC006879]|uniref:GNAT family N-acetyltransferase n=1 Tax=Streptomyces sp. NPDC006879 TaxID=3364767 RepID=UPI0036A2E105
MTAVQKQLRTASGMTLFDIRPEDPRMTEDVGPLIRALRPELTEAGFARLATEGHEQGLVFTAAYDPQGHCAGVAGHRVLSTSRGRILFVDDLVTDPTLRSIGLGGQLLEALRQRAQEADCVRIELDSGVTNQRAHRFYHRHRLAISALHFTLDVPPRDDGA